MVDEVQVMNPGDTDLKVGQVLSRGEMDKANNTVAAKKQPGNSDGEDEEAGGPPGQCLRFAVGEPGNDRQQACNARSQRASCHQCRNVELHRGRR